MKREVVQEFLNLSGLEGLALIDGRSRPYYRGVEQILNSQQREALAEGIWQVLETIPPTFDAFEFQFTGTQIYIYKLANGLILLVLAKDNLLYPDYSRSVARLRQTLEEDSQATVETFRSLLSNAQATSRTLQFVTFPGDVPLEGLDRPTAQPSPIQPSSAQASPAQASPAQASPVQASPLPASPAQASPAQASPAQASPVQSRAQASPEPSSQTSSQPSSEISPEPSDSRVAQNGGLHVVDSVTQRGGFAPWSGPSSMRAEAGAEAGAGAGAWMSPQMGLEAGVAPGGAGAEAGAKPEPIAAEPEPIAPAALANNADDADAPSLEAGGQSFEDLMARELADLATLPRRMGDTDLLPSPAPLPTLGAWVAVLNDLSQCATQYLGRAVIVNYWRVCRPEDSGLAGLSAQRSGSVIVAEPSLAASLEQPVTAQQQRKLQIWAEAFVGRCTQVIRDFPALAEQSLSPEQVKMLDL